MNTLLFYLISSYLYVKQIFIGLRDVITHVPFYAIMHNLLNIGDVNSDGITNKKDINDFINKYEILKNQPLIYNLFELIFNKIDANKDGQLTRVDIASFLMQQIINVKNDNLLSETMVDSEEWNHPESKKFKILPLIFPKEIKTVDFLQLVVELGQIYELLRQKK